MAELSLEENLQPSLLDRLTDDDPDSKTEARAMRTLSANRLKRCVMRDLTWLFNCGNLAITQDLSAYPQVESSVANFGVTDVAGLSIASTDIVALQRRFKQAILHFEPRIIPDTLRVSIEADAEKSSHNALRFKIEGQLWAHPVPVGLYLSTELDVETGNASIKDIGG